MEEDPNALELVKVSDILVDGQNWQNEALR